MAKMPTPWPATPRLRVLAAPLIAMSALAGIGYSSASAADCQSWTGGQPPSPGSTDNRLSGVVALSACDAWAVGWEIGGGPSQTLVEHWDGSSWAVVPSPSPGTTINTLNSVRAASPTSIWAVGKFRSGGGDQTLILHWNGTTWQQVPSPSPSSSELRAVRAVSADDAWAVGDYYNGTQNRTLILHWNGTTWTRVPSPDPGGPGDNDVLTGVAATSASDAWAVGLITNGSVDRTLILHWNGTRWAQVSSPNPGTRNDLTAVGATSAKNAWAVGYTDNGSGNSTLVLHWNGTRWTRSASPNGPGTDSFLSDVVATSAGSALAVGGFTGGGSGQQTLVLRWNGPAWQRVPSPNPGPSGNALFGVAASSAGNAWAVGNFRTGLLSLALAVHCC